MSELIGLLAAELPRAVRWAGALARQLRGHDIAIGGKHSGSADTDALTLADLAVQELLVAALRDMGPKLLFSMISPRDSARHFSPRRSTCQLKKISANRLR